MYFCCHHVSDQFKSSRSSSHRFVIASSVERASSIKRRGMSLVIKASVIEILRARLQFAVNCSHAVGSQITADVY